MSKHEYYICDAEGCERKMDLPYVVVIAQRRRNPGSREQAHFCEEHTGFADTKGPVDEAIRRTLST